MGDHTTLIRLLKMISLLGSPYRRSTKEYAEILDVNRSTISRYLSTLEDVGYRIARDEEERPYLERAELRKNNYIAFTEDEARFLTEIIQAAQVTEADTILQKIYLNSPLRDHAEQLVHMQAGRLYAQIRQGIRTGKRILIKGYISKNSNSVKDRLVEPQQLIHNQKVLEAFEVESGETKHFHLDRMGDVKLLRSKQKLSKYHEEKATDPFCIAGDSTVSTKLRLSIAAGQELREQFPDTRAYLKNMKGETIYEGDVNTAFKQLDRFLLKWYDQVQIEYPDQLKQHVDNLRQGKKIKIK